MKASFLFWIICFGLLFASCEQSVIEEPEVLKAAPVIETSVLPGETILYNSSAIIKYTSTNTNKCTINGQIVNCTSGEFNTGQLTQTTSYTISSTGEGGTTQKIVTVNVGAAPPNAPSLVVDKTEFKNNLNFGEKTNFSWKAEGEISSVTLNGKDVAKEGYYYTGRLFENTDFVLEVNGPGGKVTEKLTVTVGGYETSVFGLLSNKLWTIKRWNHLDSQKKYVYTIDFSVKETLMLNRDGSYVFSWDGKEVGHGDWRVSDDGKTLYLQGFPYDIKEISKDAFTMIQKVSNEESYTESEYEHAQ